MLSSDQSDELRERGHTLVPGVVDDAGVARMQAAVWAFLERRGVMADAPSDWPDTVTKLQSLRKQGAFDPFLGPTIDGICDRLMGDGNWTDLGGHPQALLTMPVPGPWVLPHKMWHFDLPAKGQTQHLGAVRFLGFVSDVDPGGGGTVVVEGSHALVRRMVEASPDGVVGSSADVRRRLALLPFFAELAMPAEERTVDLLDTATIDTATTDTATIDSVSVRVAELTGRAGDLVVMHPWLMHNIAMNCSDRPRMMMSDTRYAVDHAWF